MKKLILIAIFTAFLFSVGITAHAEEMLDRDYIESEIWQEMWLGKNDDGTEFPEASFKHHLLDEWIDENYGSDEYNWSDVEELKYSYRRYYKNYIKDWDFNDDDNGNWTIETDEHSYSFTIFQNEWLMLDENGNTVDTFPPFNTLENETEIISVKSDDDNSDTHKVKSSFDSGAETASDVPDSESMEFDEESTENATESRTDASDSITPLIVGA
ncbi:MAG: hypothetical protein IKI37_08830, partial [Oscillospiraceae bacterium]|nr:hypothetical protein [Oscillospiraceae bacterium]